MRVLSGLFLVLCLALSGFPTARAQEVTFVLLDEEGATSVSEVAVTVRRRPLSATPRFSTESILALREFGRAHLTETFRNSAGSRLSRSSDAGTISASVQMLSTPTGASRNQRRAASLRLVRAAEVALRATRSAESVFAAYVDSQASERDLLLVERQREKAVKSMLAARAAALAVLGTQDDGVFLLEDPAAPASSGAPTVEALPEGGAGWSFEQLDIQPVVRAGAPAVQVTGLIRNETAARASMPPFRVVFYDQRGLPFGGAVTMPDHRLISPGASRPFTISVTDMAAVSGSDESGVSRVTLAFGPPPRRGGQ